MPHSSGGGHHGGGSHHSSHRSSSHHSSSHHSTSHRTPSYHSTSYRTPGYHSTSHRYSRRYSSGGRIGILSSLIALIIIIFVAKFIFAVAFSTMEGGLNFGGVQKLSTDYNTTIVIKDNAKVLDKEGELKRSLEAFLDKTGVTPAVMTVNNEDWEDNYATLNDYAYDLYVNNFSDEKHWLVVYSEPQNPDPDFNDWYWEGMIGDDCGRIITDSKEDYFTDTLDKKITARSQYSVSEAIIYAFNDLSGTITESKGDVKAILPVFIFLFIIFIIFCLVVRAVIRRLRNIVRGVSNNIISDSAQFGQFVSGAANNTNNSTNSNSFNSNVNINRTVKCAYCDGEYMAGSTNVCPHCGASAR